MLVNGRGSDVLQVRGVAGLREELGRGLAAADGYTAVSQDLLEAMVELGGEKAVAALTPNGVDAAHFSPGDPAEARARLGQPLDGPLVLSVGHLIERKDPVLALRAFAAGAPEGARMVYVGRGPLAGYPVVGFKARLIGGEYDCMVSEVEHFMQAGERAIEAAIGQAGTGDADQDEELLETVRLKVMRPHVVVRDMHARKPAVACPLCPQTLVMTP